MRGVAGFLLALSAFAVRSQAASLEPLRAALTAIRDTDSPQNGVRGASPRLTEAKHQLRDWIEAQLSEALRPLNATVLKSALNAELHAARLTCREQTGSGECDSEGVLGAVNEIDMFLRDGLLTVRTGVEIQCGFDESVYFYVQTQGDWQRIGTIEQNTYTEKQYDPLRIESIATSRGPGRDTYTALILGVSPWCTSNWRRVAHQVLRLTPDADPVVLVHGKQDGFIGMPMHGAVSSSEATVEFAVASFDPGVHNRPETRHYRLSKAAATRIDPVSLTPRNFADLWLTSQWNEGARQHSAVETKVSLEQWHARMRGFQIAGEFPFPTKGCRDNPNLWQVVARAGEGLNFREVYLLVRWLPPYDFLMIQASARPRATCTVERRDVDDGPAHFLKDPKAR